MRPKLSKKLNSGKNVELVKLNLEARDKQKNALEQLDQVVLALNLNDFEKNICYLP